MSNYELLGKHIKMIDARNTESITDRVLGINIDKFFMPSVANVIGTDLSKYKLLTKGVFACNPMHVGRDERLPIALYSEDDPAIVSPAYYMFIVRDESVLDRDYLMMWFRRPEFDRVCWLKTDGSVRGGLSWDDLCRMEIPIPTIDEQKHIVEMYDEITKRINLKRRINDNLEAQAQAYFDHLFATNNEPDCTLGDIALVNPSRQLSKGSIAKCFDMATLPTKGCIPEGETIKPYNGGTRFINGDTLIARITPCLENGKAAFINVLEDEEVAFGSTEFIVFASKDDVPPSFYYFLIRNSRFVTFALQFMNGSSGRQRVSGEELASFSLKRPSSLDLQKFDAIGSKILLQMRDSVREIKALQELQTSLTATLSSR